LFLCDEYQHFATVGESEPTGDEKFFSLSRQPKCIPIIATQSISSLKSALPGESWRTLLQTFRTKIFLSLSDDFSARIATELCGREDKLKASYNLSESGHEANVSFLTGKALSHKANITASKSYSPHHDPRFDTRTFMELRNAQSVTIAYDGTNPSLLPQALLQQRKQILLSPACGRRTLMNGFETILPFLKPIEHLILNDSISEVMVNGPDRIFIETAGFVEPIQGVNLGEKFLMVAVKNIARRLGDDISESKPILDSRLPDGSRVAAVIPPCSVNGVTLTIRKFNARHFGVEDLVQAGTLEQWLANQLENYILARKNILIVGGTGSGKTTMLNVLGKFIPSDERVLLIEDTSEIHMDQDNLVRFEARQPQNGLPAITIRDLLKASLRHRPDRIILGEIRGGEAFDLLQLLNTGHSGSLSTVHASSARQGLARFTSCVLQSGVDLPYRAIKTNVGDSVNVVVHLERRPGRRFVSEVVEIHGYDPDRDEYNYGFVFDSHKELL